jgi:hypothetical protein
VDEIIDINTLFGPQPAGSADLPVDELLEMMKAANVRRAFTMSTLGILISPQIGNAASRAACTEHPELVPVATLNPLQYFGDTASVSGLRNDGFGLVRFFPIQQGWPIDIAPFRALLGALSGSKLPIMVEVARPGEITALSRVAGDYPGVVILAGVNDTLLAEAIALMREKANWYVETSQLLGCGCLKAVADFAGPERLLHGTGAPAAPMISAFQTLRASGLAPDAMAQVVGGNARRALGL